jgi:VEFS-Box of polycomb protein
MKLWNMHVRAFAMPADAYAPLLCSVFARRHAPALLAAGLRASFALHLFNLWDNCLVAPAHIRECLRIVNEAEIRLKAEAEEEATAAAAPAVAAAAAATASAAGAAAAAGAVAEPAASLRV